MRLVLVSVFFICCFRLCAQQTAAADNTIKKILQIQEDTLLMDSLYHYAKITLDKDPAGAIKAGKLLLKDAQLHGNQRVIADANFIIGEGYEYVPDYANSLVFYLEALRLQKEQNRYSNEIGTILGIAHIYGIINDTAKEKKYVENAMVICNQNKKNEKVRRKQPIVADYLATVYKKEGKLDVSIRLYNEAIELAKQDSDLFSEMASLCNMAIALKSDKNYAASLAAYKQAITLTDTVNDLISYDVILDNMAILFYQMGDMARSEQYSFMALSVGLKIHYTEALVDIYDNLKNTFRSEKKYPQALEYFSKWSDAKDTLFSRNKIQELQELQTKFDLTDKDKQIAEQDKEIEIGKLDISRKKTERSFLVACIFMLATIGILLINRQRIKQKKLEGEKAHAENELKGFKKSIYDKNLIIERVTEEIKRLKEGDEQQIDNTLITQLEQSIILTDEQWENFRILFGKVYKNFFVNLKKKIPDLTQAEIRLLALTRLKLSSKEMAAMMGISPNTIRIYRHRLRRKLNLDKEEMIEELVDNI